MMTSMQCASSSSTPSLEEELVRDFKTLSLNPSEKEKESVPKPILFPPGFDEQTERLMYSVYILAQEKFCFQGVSYVHLTQAALKQIILDSKGQMTAKRYCLPTTSSINSWCYIINLDRPKEWAEDFSVFRRAAIKLIPPDSMSARMTEIEEIKKKVLRIAEKIQDRAEDLELFWKFLIFEGYHSVQMHMISIIKAVSEYFDEHFSVISEAAKIFLASFNEFASREQELFFAAKHDYDESYAEGNLKAWEAIKQFSDKASSQEQDRFYASMKVLVDRVTAEHEKLCNRYRDLYAELLSHVGSPSNLFRSILLMLARNPKLLHIRCTLKMVCPNQFQVETISGRDKARISAIIPTPEEYAKALTADRFHFPLEELYDEYAEKKRTVAQAADLSLRQIEALAKELEGKKRGGRRRGAKVQKDVILPSKDKKLQLSKGLPYEKKSLSLEPPIHFITEEELKEFVAVKSKREAKAASSSAPFEPLLDRPWLLHDRVARWFQPTRDVRREDSAYAQITEQFLKNVRAHHAFGMKLYGFLIQHGSCYEGEDRQSFFLKGTLRKKDEEEKSCVFTLSRDRKTHVIFHAFATRHTAEEVVKQYALLGYTSMDNPSRLESVYAPKTGVVKGFDDGSIVKEYITGQKVVVEQLDGTKNTAFFT